MRVGVIVPVHGWAPYLAEALDAILGQDPAPDEVVVVDDGSPEPVQLHVDHAHALPGRPPAPSAAGCRPRGAPGFERAGRPSSSRCATPTTRGGPASSRRSSRRCATARRRRRVLRARRGHRPRRPADRRALARPADRRCPALYERNPVCVSGALLRRDAVERAGGIARDLPAAEDWDLWLRLLASGASARRSRPTRSSPTAATPGAMSGDVTTLARAQLASTPPTPGWSTRRPRRAGAATCARSPPG